MHDSESVWVATPSLHETFIHNTLPALTGALPASSTIRFRSAKKERVACVIIALTCLCFAVWKALSKPLASS